MIAYLKLQSPDKPAAKIPLGGTATIGRTPGNDLILAGDPLVSRQHAVIRCQNHGHFQIVDLGSKNGTFVDGRQVILPVALREGVEIRIGRSTMTFHFSREESTSEGMDFTLAGTTQTNPVHEIGVAILVCDIRGFSSISETLPPAAVSKFIGKWFLRIGEIVECHGGQIDKFIGDAVLAYWPGEPGNACRSALSAAEEMSAQAAQLQWPGDGTAMQTAVALHHGEVSCGNIGTVAQRDATIMGDNVNTVFRMESVMKTMGVSFLCSRAFYENVGSTPGFSDLGDVELKGKSRPVRVFGRR